MSWRVAGAGTRVHCALGGWGQAGRPRITGQACKSPDCRGQQRTGCAKLHSWRARSTEVSGAFGLYSVYTWHNSAVRSRLISRSDTCPHEHRRHRKRGPLATARLGASWHLLWHPAIHMPTSDGRAVCGQETLQGHCTTRRRTCKGSRLLSGPSRAAAAPK